VEAAVREGRLPAGARLPAVRGAADELGVSPATVAAAYRALRLRGLVAGAGRGGTRVSARPAVRLPAPDDVPAGLRDLASGNPDPALLPSLRAHLARLPDRSRLYGGPHDFPALVDLARADFGRDGVKGRVAVLGGALDAVERVLQAHVGPGDRIAVEDPGFTGVLDLVGALGLVVEPVAVDESGPLPEALAAALKAGVRAVVLTPRAQNPTGAAWDEARARRLRALLDDGPEAGGPGRTFCSPRRLRWVVVRSVFKSFGPDLRSALGAGDDATIDRVRGRQSVGAGWVSHLQQELLARVWEDPGAQRRLREAEARYAERRAALVEALARRGVAAWGRTGLNVWIPLAEEAAATAALAARGWAVRPGERYRLRSGPGIRVTTSALRPADTARLAEDVARAAGGGGRRP
jgi:DNA-binding transcriptional MocR family regulator